MGESIIFDFGSIAEHLPKEPKIIKPKPVEIASPSLVDPFHPLVFLDVSALRMLVIRDSKYGHAYSRTVHPDDFRFSGFRTVHFNGAMFEVR